MPTRTDIIRKLAEFSGWQVGGVDSKGRIHGYHPKYTNDKGPCLYEVPYFMDDLNAMHEVEELFKQRGLFRKYLRYLCVRFDFYDWRMAKFSQDRMFALLHATAEQRATAAYYLILNTEERDAR